MKPPSFDYAAPRTLGEAVALLEKHRDDAKLLAGGQSLIPLLNMRLARPALLVDLNRVEGLDHIRESNGEISIGAMTRKRSVERSDLVRTRQPLLHAATLLVAHPPIRNRGTVGGSLAHADPAAEYPAVAITLDAELDLLGPSGTRTVQARDFFVTYLTTCLDNAEVIREVRFPALPRRTGWAILEIARRQGDFAMVGVAVTLTVGDDGRCTDARIVPFGVGPVPVRITEAEAVLTGERREEHVFSEAAAKVMASLEEPPSDLHASSEYRRHLAGTLTRRALVEAASRVETS